MRERVGLEWRDVSTTNSRYRIERSPFGQDKWAAVGADLVGTARVGSDTTATLGATYDCRVTAVGSGLHAPSAPVRVTLTPEAPRGVWSGDGVGAVSVRRAARTPLP